ncbi:poly-beta-1,6-N-acetyl-D-glucosamine synthase [Hydrogenophaga sp. OTU3427]|uniref:poly-beta-1,6-N-acetyl-D-glucosamine synthase n=1 Tax=Hydrogenophaga sp. OTU3427 TaxID=3043856 RepID=UPI00313EFB46
MMPTDALQRLQGAFLAFLFFYPMLMAWAWMAGGLVHALWFERGHTHGVDPLADLAERPLVSVLIPCFNESSNVQHVIGQLLATEYPHVEVIAINDGSSDDTGPQLDALARRHTRLRVLHHARNQGKAVALNTGTLLARSEFLMCIDGDALLNPDAIGWLLRHLLDDPLTGAVTGNPRIRTRSTLLGRMQVGEFSSTIGLIKRTQQLLGSLFTVSGVITLFRRSAVLQAGLWSTDVLTEDIDMTWRLQLRGWRVRFEPRALCWILMPETLGGLYKQRQRWATGGMQTMMRYGPVALHPRHWRLWPVMAEYLTSVVWAYGVLFTLAGSIALALWPGHQPGPQLTSSAGLLLALTCLLQLLVSLLVDRRYDQHLLRYYAWTLWYPLAFWLINLLTTTWALPQALKRARGMRATWTSPDRGFTRDN